MILLSFGILVIVMLALDLGVFQRRAHFPSMKEALIWSAVWIIMAFSFNLFVFLKLGSVKAMEFFAGYVVEEALSVDNIFVFVIIFSYFAVPPEFQHRVLYWGVLSAVVMRAAFIVAGAALVAQFHWVLYLFGIFLIYTAVRLALQKETEVHPERNPFVRYCRRFFPMTPSYEGSTFFVHRDGKRFITPLLLVLVMIETTDLAFATDSIPAIFAITRDPIIIYTSNISAILGLRTLYFVLANFMRKFRYLKVGLSVVLSFIGAKMLIEHWFIIPIHSSILVIFIILAVSIVSSIARKK
ncbi:MAG: TerC family protein [Bacteroidota bacterium]|jgi:tellurite resistance protein TerC